VPAEQFPDPPTNTAQKPVLRGSDSGIKLTINRVTGKIASSSTPDEFKVDKTYLPPHDILYYVNKDDPQGPPPANPADDPQYNNWESSLQDWVMRQQAAGIQLTLEDPPTEYDTPQSVEFAPTLIVTSPTNEQILYSRQIDVQVQASAPRGVSKVTCFIDGQQIGESDAYPFSVSYYGHNLAQGEHKLSVIAEDDLGNSAVQDVPFNMQAPLDPPSVDWFDTNTLNLRDDDFPRAFYLMPYRWNDIKQIQIYVQSAGEEKLIYTFSHIADTLNMNKLMFIWQHNPGAGDYMLKAKVLDNNGGTAETDLSVSVE